MSILEIWGHRGARGLFPENTLEGIADACALGIDGVEIDVALTADFVPVLSHDPGLSGDLVRGPDGSWLDSTGPRIRDMTAATLARYDVGRARPGGRTALAFPEQRPRDGARMPRLAEVLAALDTRVLIELKTFPDRPAETHSPARMASAVADAILHAGAAERVIVESFDWRGLRLLRREHPQLRLAFLTCAATEANAALWWDGVNPADYAGSIGRAIAAEGGEIWAAEHDTITPERIAEAHAAGLRLIGWTVNRPAEIARLIAWAADGVVTDRPDIACEVLASAGRNPRPVQSPDRSPR